MRITAGLTVLASVTLAAGCATTGTPAPAIAGATAPPTAPVFDVDDFIAKSGADIDALLGEPNLTRIEGEGEYRRYALAECSLIIILYPDESGEKRARRLDAAALRSGEESPDLGACLAKGAAPRSP